MDGKRTKATPSPDRVTGDERTLAWIMTGMAGFGSVIGWIVPILAIGPRELTLLALLLILPFFLASAWFGWLAAQLWLRLFRWGRAEGRLEPTPPRVGEPLAVTLTYDRTPTLPRDWLGVLICEQRTNEGKSRTFPLWRQDVRAVAQGPAVRFVFTPPGTLPAARSGDEASVVWRLLAQSTEPYLDREIHLPVASAASEPDPGAESRLEEAQAQRERRMADRASIQSRLSKAGVHLLLGNARGRIRLRSTRHRGLAIVMLILALMFGTGGLLTLSSMAAQGAWTGWGPWLMTITFIVGSSAAFATWAYRIRDRRLVEWGDGRIRVSWGNLLGQGEVDVPLDRIERLKPWVSYESGTDRGPDPARESVAIAAVTDDERLIPLLDGIPSRWDAEGLLDILAREWGVAKEGLGTFDHPPGYRPRGTHVIWNQARPRVLASAVAFAGLLVLGALVLRVDVGAVEGSGTLETPFSVRFGEGPAGTGAASTLIQEARAAAQEAASRPPYPAAVADDVELSGTWTLTLPAGFQSEARLLQVWTREYELTSSTVLRGTYELRDGDLVVIDSSDPRLTELVWRVTGPDRLVLIEAPDGRVMGSDYKGAVLERVPSDG